VIVSPTFAFVVVVFIVAGVLVSIAFIVIVFLVVWYCLVLSW